MFIFSVALLLGAAAPDTIRAEEVFAEYPALFGVAVRETADGDTAVSVYADGDLPPRSRLVAFARDNQYFLNYLLQHAANLNLDELRARAAHPETLRQYVAAQLRDDPKFNVLLLPVLQRYLGTQGVVVQGLPAALEPDTVSLDRVLAIAARFFYPSSLEGGRLFANICVGVNGLRDLEGGRNVPLEAFVYDAIWRDLREPKYHVAKEFRTELGRFAQMNLSSDPETKLIRLQGLAWAHMAQNADLRKLLLEAYSERAAYLPFQISGIEAPSPAS